MAKTKTPGTIETRGKSKRIILYAGGTRHTFTIKGATDDEARAFAESKHAELQEREKRRALGLPVAITVKALLDKYEAEYLPLLSPNTQRCYPKSIRPIRVFFVDKLGNPHIDAVRAAHVSDYMSWRRVHGPDGKRRKNPLSNRTIELDRAVLHRVFAIAEKLELRDGNPVGRVDPPKVEERDPVLLTEEQYDSLIEACGENAMLRTWALVLGESGVRAHSEAGWLRWGDLDLAEGFLWIDSTRHGRRTKGGKGRWVPMTEKLREALRDHAARYRLQTYHGQRSPWVFHHERTIRKAKAGERVKSFRDAFDRAREAAKLPDGFVAHDLRHRRATLWIAKGGKVVHVKEALGHSAIQTTMRYTHLARTHLRDLVEEEPSRPTLEGAETA